MNHICVHARDALKSVFWSYLREFSVSLVIGSAGKIRE